MQLSFRAKLFAIAATTAAGFLVLLVTNMILSARVSRELARVERTYLPKVELGPKVDRGFENVSRALQDAVARRDGEGLAEVRHQKDELLSELEAAKSVLDPVKVEALRAAIEDWYQTASSISVRLIDGETGEAIVDAMVAMQHKQRRATTLLEDTTRFDRRQLAQAFADAASAQRTAFRIRIAVIVTCLAAVTGLVTWLGLDVLRSIGELRAGFERFSKGQLDHPIPVTSQDDIGALALHANRMADALRRTVGELEAFNYSVSHDLRAPLRPLDGFSQALIEDYGDKLDDKARDYLKRIRAAAQRMSQLIEDMLQLSRLNRAELVEKPVDLSHIADSIVGELRRLEPDRAVEFVATPAAKAVGDARLLRIALENLLRNAWKFSRKTASARIELGFRPDGAFFVRDNGAGFDPAYAAKLFQPFQRLHAATEFEGTGIGLAIVQRIVRRHHGRVWAEGKPGEGATIYFTLHDGDAA